MEPANVPCLAAFLHLILVESLPVYAFYLSFTDMLVQAFGFCYVWALGFQEPELSSSQRVGEYVYCNLNDIWSASFSLDLYWTGDCADFSDGSNIAGYINFGCLGMCCISIAWMGLSMVLSGATDICSGRYLAHQLRLEHGSFSKVVSKAMAIYSTLVFVALFVMVMLLTGKRKAVYPESLDGQMLASFIFYQLAPILVVVGSAMSLSASCRPNFEYDSEDFMNLRFHRSWFSLFSNRSVDFVRSFEHAVLLGHSGVKSELANLLKDAADVNHVLNICKVQSSREEERLGLLQLQSPR